LFLVAVGIFYMAVDRNALKVKTLNHFLPSVKEIKSFNEHPAIMSREQLTDILVYYKKGCDYTANDPEQPAPCSMAGYAYYYLGDTKQAIRYYQYAIRGNEYFFWLYFNLGVIYYNEGLYDKASEEFGRALNVSPEKSMYFLVLTKTYKEIALFLGIGPEDYMDSLKEGYDLAKEFQVVSQLFVKKPEVRTQLDVKKIKLRLF